MICAQCGNRVQKGHRFCGNCGARVDEKKAPSQADHPKDRTSGTDSATSLSARVDYDDLGDSEDSTSPSDDRSVPSNETTTIVRMGGSPGEFLAVGSAHAGPRGPLPRIGLWVAAGVGAASIIAAAIVIPVLIREEGNPGDSGGGLALITGDSTTTTTTAAPTTVSAPPSSAAPATTVAAVPVGDGIDSDYDATTTQVVEDPVDVAPEAHILSPSQGAVFTANTQDGNGQWYIDVSLQGQGTDLEDGTLAGGSLVWRDSVNGGPAQVIGNGTSLTVPLAAPNTFGNTHTITLTVTDSHGNTGKATITITVSLLS